MTRDELMQMARGAGAAEFYPETQSVKEQNYIVGARFLERFSKAILERAAAECDSLKDRYKGMAEEEDKTGMEDSKYWNYISPLAGAAYDIRAMKIREGE